MTAGKQAPQWVTFWAEVTVLKIRIDMFLAAVVTTRKFLRRRRGRGVGVVIGIGIGIGIGREKEIGIGEGVRGVGQGVGVVIEGDK